MKTYYGLRIRHRFQAKIVGGEIAANRTMFEVGEISAKCKKLTSKQCKRQSDEDLQRYIGSFSLCTLRNTTCYVRLFMVED